MKVNDLTIEEMFQSREELRYQLDNKSVKLLKALTRTIDGLNAISFFDWTRCDSDEPMYRHPQNPCSVIDELARFYETIYERYADRIRFDEVDQGFRDAVKGLKKISLICDKDSSVRIELCRKIYAEIDEGCTSNRTFSWYALRGILQSALDAYRCERFSWVFQWRNAAKYLRSVVREK